MADAPKKPAVMPPGLKNWLTIEKAPEGKWRVLELVTDGPKIADVRTVETVYYRDLAEDAVRKRLRKLGR